MSTLAVSNTEERAAYSPTEYARLFGKSITWAYRLIERGEIRAVIVDGTKMIPATEVERLLNGNEAANG